MSQKLSHQPLAVRYEHLLKVFSSKRFLEMRGLNNDLPFFICEYKAAEEFELQRMRRQLANALAGQTVACLSGRGVKVLEINLYDLSVELLKASEGGDEGVSVWQQIMTDEPEFDKNALIELIQNVLDVKGYFIPAIAEKLSDNSVLTQELTPKARDPYLYLHLMERDHKPFKYVVLLGRDAFAPDVQKGLLGPFKGRLLADIRDESFEAWKRKHIADCMVLSVASWNQHFPEWPLRREAMADAMPPEGAVQ